MMMTRFVLTLLIGLVVPLGTSAAFAETFQCKRYTDGDRDTKDNILEKYFPKSLLLGIDDWTSRDGNKVLTKVEGIKKYRLLPNGIMIASMKIIPGKVFKPVVNVRYKCDRTSLQLVAGLRKEHEEESKVKITENTDNTSNKVKQNRIISENLVIQSDLTKSLTSGVKIKRIGQKIVQSKSEFIASLYDAILSNKPSLLMLLEQNNRQKFVVENVESLRKIFEGDLATLAKFNSAVPSAKPKADPTPANTATTTQFNSLTSIAMTTGSIEPWMSSTSERFEDRIIRNWCAPPNETTLGGEPFLDPNSSTWNRCAVNKGPKPSPISYETVKRFYTKSENRKLLCRRVKKYKSYEETLSLLKSGTSKSALTYFILARDVELDCSKKEAVNSDVLSANAIEQLDSERQKRIKLEQQLAALKAQQEQQKQTFSSDARLPKITIASVNTKGKQGIVRGRVKDNTGIAEVTVGGIVVPVTSSGDFEYTTFVPSGGLTLKVQATDLAGLTSMMSVTLERNAVTAAAAINFDRLNPMGKRVKVNKDAIALIVGVSDYENTPAKAVFADADAMMFHDYASEKLGIPESRIKTLVNDAADERELLLSVKSWLTRASKQGKSDVYVFFAGHGLASDDGQKMYLLPHDGAPELLEKTAILRQELFDDIASANPRSVTVFLDTCYSGTTRGTDMLIASRPIAIKALEQSIPDNFTVFTAAAGDQTAKPLEEAKHGMFSYFLMKGMEGEADKNQDNKITAGELHQYVQSNVVQQSSGSQTPELQGDENRVLVQFQ